MAFRELIELVRDSQPVDASNANRPTSQLDGNVRQLRDWLDEAAIGSTIIDRNQTVDINAKLGQPVFYNSTRQHFARAIGNAVVNSQGIPQASVSSQVWGIILRKPTATSADILVQGVANVDLSAAIDNAPTLGEIYYLSNASEGKLVLQRPPVGVAVLQVAGSNADGTHRVRVAPRFYDLSEAHRHYRFQLRSVPAGDHVLPTVGGRHKIVNPREDEEGWLPVGAFTDVTPPAGAVFGYNIAASPLRDLWPPLPISGAYLEWNKGQDKRLLNMGVPLGPDQLCVINRDGIWWMSDCYDDVPWLVNYTGSLSESVSGGYAECPRDLSPLMILWFSKPLFATTDTAVLSLTPVDGSRLKITCLGTDTPATTGHLQIDLNIANAIGSDSQPGYLFFKDFNDKGEILRGPGVESLSAGSNRISLTSLVHKEGRHYGNVVIDADNDLAGREVAIDTVRLSGVEEEFFEDTIALGFPKNRDSSFRGRLLLSNYLTVPEDIRLKLRFWFLNRSASDVPAGLFSLTYRRIPQPGNVNQAASLPLSVSEQALGSLPTSDIDVDGQANKYFLAESNPFVVTAGDIVLFWLSRAGGSDGFGGNVQLLRQCGVFVKVE